jgi:hypothetical protein
MTGRGRERANKSAQANKHRFLLVDDETRIEGEGVRGVAFEQSRATNLPCTARRQGTQALASLLSGASRPPVRADVGRELCEDIILALVKSSGDAAHGLRSEC